MSVLERTILGTVQLGLDYGINNKDGVPSIVGSAEILAKAHECGIRFLDTASAYGRSHEAIAHYHQKGGRFSVYSKIAGAESAGLIEQQVDAVLSELELQTVDLISFHDPEMFASLPNRTLAAIKSKMSGRVRRWGVSVYSNEQARIALEKDEIDTVQIPFNLFDNWSSRRPIFEFADRLGKEIHVRSVFLQGLFFIEPDELPSKLRALKGPLEKIKKIGEHWGDLGDLALNYPYQFESVRGVLMGVDNVAQLETNLSAIGKKIPEELMDEIHGLRIEDENLLNPSNW